MKRLTILVAFLAILSALAPTVTAITAPPTNELYVEGFGAVGGDGADDAAAFNAACATAGTKAVRLKAKVYDFASTVTTNGATIRGQGIDASTCHMLSAWTGQLFTVSSNTEIVDLTIDGNDDASTGGAQPSASQSNIRLNRVKISDFSSGSSCGTSGTSGISYTNCWFTSNATAFSCTTASSGVNVLNCAFDNNTTAISLQAALLGGLVQGCSFTSNTTAIDLSSGPSNVVVTACAFISGTTSIAPSSGARCSIGDNYWAFDEIVPSDVADLQTKLRGTYYGTVSPASGHWETGEFVQYSTPGATDNKLGWHCNSGGTSGTWQVVYRGPTARSTTWDPPANQAAGAYAKTTITTTGLSIGQSCTVAFSQSLPDGFHMAAKVTSSTNIDVFLLNTGGSGTNDVASGTVTVHLFQ